MPRVGILFPDFFTYPATNAYALDGHRCLWRKAIFGFFGFFIHRETVAKADGFTMGEADFSSDYFGYTPTDAYGQGHLSARPSPLRTVKSSATADDLFVCPCRLATCPGCYEEHRHYFCGERHGLDEVRMPSHTHSIVQGNGYAVRRAAPTHFSRIPLQVVSARHGHTSNGLQPHGTCLFYQAKGFFLVCQGIITRKRQHRYAATFALFLIAEVGSLKENLRHAKAQ